MKKAIIVLLTLSLVTTHLAFGTLTKEYGRQKRRKKSYHKALLSLKEAKKGHYQGKKVKGITKRCKRLRSQITNRRACETYDCDDNEYS